MLISSLPQYRNGQRCTIAFADKDHLLVLILRPDFLDHQRRRRKNLINDWDLSRNRRLHSSAGYTCSRLLSPLFALHWGERRENGKTIERRRFLAPGEKENVFSFSPLLRVWGWRREFPLHLSSWLKVLRRGARISLQFVIHFTSSVNKIP